jgi:HK97 family phage major capsid protein
MTRFQRIAEMETLLDRAEKEKRLLSEAEQKQFDEHKAAIQREDAQALIEKEEKLRRSKPQGRLTPIAAPAVHTDKGRRYSLARVMRALSGDHNVDVGYERELHQEMAKGREKAPEGFLVPYSAFITKAQDTVTPSPDTGIATTGTDYRGDLLERINSGIFRPPIAQALGVTHITSNESTVLIPRLTNKLNANWIARDGNASASSDATFDSITMTPTTLAILYELRRSIVYGIHPDAEALLISDARTAIELALDDAIIAGTGASNQPSGFLTSATASANYGGATHVTTSNAYDAGAKLRDEIEAYILQANPSLKWLLHPLWVAQLRKTPAFSGALTPLVGSNDTQWANRTFVESYALPAPAGGPPVFTQGLVGDYSECVSCVFGQALEVIANPYADSVFSKGSVLFRGLMDTQTCHRDPKRVIKFNTDTL